MQALFLTMAMAWASMIIFVVAPVALVIYVSLRVREARSDRHDPQLGLKLVLNLLLTYAVLVGVGGAATVCNEVASSVMGTPRPSLPATPFSTRRRPANPKQFISSELRVGFGTMLAGLGLAYIYGRLLRTTTNSKLWPACSRAFTGFRTVFHGAVFSVSALLLLVSLLEASESTVQMSTSSFCFAAVWGLAFAIELKRLDFATTLGDGPGENYACNHCGMDLRQEKTAVKCPGCGGAVALAVRHELSRLRQPRMEETPVEAPHPLD